MICIRNHDDIKYIKVRGKKVDGKMKSPFVGIPDRDSSVWLLFLRFVTPLIYYECAPPLHSSNIIKTISTII